MHWLRGEDHFSGQFVLGKGGKQQEWNRICWNSLDVWYCEPNIMCTHVHTSTHIQTHTRIAFLSINSRQLCPHLPYGCQIISPALLYLSVCTCVFWLFCFFNVPDSDFISGSSDPRLYLTSQPAKSLWVPSPKLPHAFTASLDTSRKLHSTVTCTATAACVCVCLMQVSISAFVKSLLIYIAQICSE